MEGERDEVKRAVPVADYATPQPKAQAMGGLSVMGLAKAFFAVMAILGAVTFVIDKTRGEGDSRTLFYAAVCGIVWFLLTFVRRL